MSMPDSTPTVSGDIKVAARPVPEAVEGSPSHLALSKAVKKGQVSFHQVATAWFRAQFDRDLCKANGESPDTYWKLFPELLQVFGEQRGGVISSYFCCHIRVAAALTDISKAAEGQDGELLSVQDLEREREKNKRLRGRVYGWMLSRRHPSATNVAIHLEPTFGDPDSPQAKALLFRCQSLQYQALEYLKPKPRKICMRRIFNVITTLLGSLDAHVKRDGNASAFDQNHDEQQVLEREMASAEAYFVQSAQRTARLEYLIGMLPGLGLATGLALLLRDTEWVPDHMTVAFAAGAAGALVSVLTRLTSDKLALNHEVGKATLRILGGIRPFIGAVIGAVLYLLIGSGILEVFEVPRDGEQALFYAGVGFLAGFSERWAQDMIDPARLAGASAPPAKP